MSTDVNQGVVNCVTSLIMAMAQDDLEAFAVCYQKAVDRLHRVSLVSYLSTLEELSSLQLVIEREYSATYAYYKVPSPWLQVKLLRLLQYYPPSGAVQMQFAWIFLTFLCRGPYHSHRFAPGPANNHEQFRRTVPKRPAQQCPKCCPLRSHQLSNPS